MRTQSGGGDRMHETEKNDVSRLSRRELLMCGGALFTASTLGGNDRALSGLSATPRIKREKAKKKQIGRLMMNVLAYSNSENFCPFIRWDRRVTLSESPILTVSGKQYGSAAIFDNGWFD